MDSIDDVRSARSVTPLASALCLTQSCPVLRLPQYLEQLCDEDMELKMRGTSMLLQLARNVTNLGVLIQQEAMLSALTRVLKEDYKKSQPLALNIMQIFFKCVPLLWLRMLVVPGCVCGCGSLCACGQPCASFSVFEEMHPTLLSSRVGDLTMKVVDLESRRHSARMDVRCTCLVSPRFSASAHLCCFLCNRPRVCCMRVTSRSSSGWHD